MNIWNFIIILASFEFQTVGKLWKLEWPESTRIDDGLRDIKKWHARAFVTPFVLPRNLARSREQFEMLMFSQIQFVRVSPESYNQSNYRPFRSFKLLTPASSDVIPAVSSSPEVYWQLGPSHTVSKSYDSASKDFVASFASWSHCCFVSASWWFCIERGGERKHVNWFFFLVLWRRCFLVFRLLPASLILNSLR